MIFYTEEWCKTHKYTICLIDGSCVAGNLKDAFRLFDEIGKTDCSHASDIQYSNKWAL